MPLRKSKVSVLISQGVQTKVDHKVLPIESLTLLENGEFSKVGRIGKRRGYSKVVKGTSGIINYRDDLISRNVSRDTDDDGTEASVYSESAATFQGNKGWSSGLNYSPLTVSRGSSLHQKNAQVAVSADGKYALVTFVSVDVIRAGGDTLTINGTVTKKCSLIDRVSNTVIVSDIQIGTNITGGGHRMRPVWANDKFYIVGEDQGNICIWVIDPAEATIQLRNTVGGVSLGGNVLITNPTAVTGTQDYPYALPTSYPWTSANNGGGFDAMVSRQTQTDIILVRKRVSGGSYYVEYGVIDVSGEASYTASFNDYALVGNTGHQWVAHVSNIGAPGGVATNDIMLAYQDDAKVKVIAFPESASASSAVVSRLAASTFPHVEHKFAFVDNPSPIIGANQDVDFYLSDIDSGRVDRYPAINSGSTARGEVAQNGYMLFAFAHSSTLAGVKGPVTLGLTNNPADLILPDAPLAPVLLASTDMATSVPVEGKYYTGKQYLRERDYLTTNSLEIGYCEEEVRVSEPGWLSAPVAVPGKVLALPIATNFNNYFGNLVTNSVITLFDIRDEDYNTKCKPSSAMLKDTLYIADNGLYSYDSDKMNMHGIIQRPTVSVAESVDIAEGVGALTAGEKYFYKGVFEWEDALGNLHQSESSASDSAAAPATYRHLIVTHPVNLIGSEYTSAGTYDDPTEIYRDIKFSMYRTRGNGTLYNLNNSIPNFVRGTYYKEYVDRQSNDSNSLGRFLYTDTGELPNSPPPSPSIYVIAHKGRLFTIGKDNNIYFSKLAVSGFGLGFNQALKITTPNAQSDTPAALGSMDGVLYIFTEKSIYYLLGEGPDNLGNGEFYEPKRLPSPVGAAHLSPVKLIDNGLLFTCSQGIFLIDRNQAITEIGAPVEDLLGSNKVLDIKVDTERQIAYFQTSSATAELITYNYGMKQWGRDVLQGEGGRIDSIEINQDRLVISTGTNLYFSDSSYTDDATYVPLKLKTAWIKLDTLQGYQRVYSFQILGESINPHKLTVNVRYDYDGSMTPDVYEFTSTSTGTLQFKGHPTKQKCQAIQFEIVDEDASSSDKSGYTISQIELEVGYKPDQYKNGLFKLPASQTVGSN